jgi:hypothetical protein
MTQPSSLPHLLRGLALVATLGAAAAQAAQPSTLTLKPCRLRGVEHDARGGVLKRPLDPAQPQGTQIDIHVAVLPAVARVKKPEPVLFFAGGPGQSAIELAHPISHMLSLFGKRRDVVLIDQRGTVRSAPLKCAEESPGEPLAKSLQMERQKELWQACVKTLTDLPHGDLRHLAMWRRLRRSALAVKEARSSPVRASEASHCASATSVLRPGTALTWWALTIPATMPTPSKAAYGLFQ